MHLLPALVLQSARFCASACVSRKLFCVDLDAEKEEEEEKKMLRFVASSVRNEAKPGVGSAEKKMPSLALSAVPIVLPGSFLYGVPRVRAPTENNSKKIPNATTDIRCPFVPGLPVLLFGKCALRINQAKG